LPIDLFQIYIIDNLKYNETEHSTPGLDSSTVE